MTVLPILALPCWCKVPVESAAQIAKFHPQIVGTLHDLDLRTGCEMRQGRVRRPIPSAAFWGLGHQSQDDKNRNWIRGVICSVDAAKQCGSLSPKHCVPY